MSPGDEGQGTDLFVVLCIINLLNYIDRQAVTGLLEPIRREFGATDAQMGLVGLAFLLTYALLPPVFGWLGDRRARTKVIGASAAFWSIATAATALTRGVGQLAAMRAAVGVGEASYMANAPSLILDLFAPANRGRAMSVFYAASPVGAALGVTLGGALWPLFGWRGACAIVGLPGLIAALFIARRREPSRGRFDPGTVARAPRAVRASAHDLVHNRVYVLMTLAYGGLVFTQHAVEFWLPTVLQRDKHIPLSQANAGYGAAVLVGGLLGPLVGIGVADWLRRRDSRAYFHVAAATSLLMVAPLVGIGLSVAWMPLFGNVFAEALFGNASIGIIITLIVATVAPEMRSTATAVALTAVHLIGDVISQPLVGHISTALEHATTSVGPAWSWIDMLGLTQAQHLLAALVAVAVPGALAASVMFLIAGRAEYRRQVLLGRPTPSQLN